MQHYLFCLRHYNDIDNIAPAVYFLLQRKSTVRATILIYSLDYPFRSDPGLSFLKESFSERIRIVWIGDFKGYNYRITSNSRLRVWNYGFRKVFAAATLERAIKYQQSASILTPALSLFFSDWGLPRQAVFDQNRTSLIIGLICALRECGIKRIISLPVSPWVNINILRQTDFINVNADIFAKKHDYKGFDQIGQVDRFYAQSLNDFFRLLGRDSPFANKVTVLGSIRYCSEWMALRKRYSQPFVQVDGHSRTRLLILPSHQKNNSFWDEFMRTLKFISQFKNYEILLKPHTRYGEGYENIPENILFVHDHDTSALIDWADVILYWGTSVALEGFAKNKTMICLDYINANKSIFHLFKAGYLVRCRDDLMACLISYPKMNNILDYDPEGENRLVQEVIHGGGHGDIPGRYIDFIDGELPVHM